MYLTSYFWLHFAQPHSRSGISPVIQMHSVMSCCIINRSAKGIMTLLTTPFLRAVALSRYSYLPHKGDTICSLHTCRNYFIPLLLGSKPDPALSLARKGVLHLMHSHSSIKRRKGMLQLSQPHQNHRLSRWYLCLSIVNLINLLQLVIKCWV